MFRKRVPIIAVCATARKRVICFAERVHSLALKGHIKIISIEALNTAIGGLDGAERINNFAPSIDDIVPRVAAYTFAVADAPTFTQVTDLATLAGVWVEPKGAFHTLVFIIVLRTVGNFHKRSCRSGHIILANYGNSNYHDQLTNRIL